MSREEEIRRRVEDVQECVGAAVGMLFAVWETYPTPDTAPRAIREEAEALTAALLRVVPELRDEWAAFKRPPGSRRQQPG